jgi:hypothetical protein
MAISGPIEKSAAYQLFIKRYRNDILECVKYSDTLRVPPRRDTQGYVFAPKGAAR